MTYMLKDPWLGERPFPTTPLALIDDQHRVLLAMKADGRVPSQELLDDIAAYDAILGSADPAARASEYLDYRRELGVDARTMRPRHVARAKGWIK